MRVRAVPLAVAIAVGFTASTVVVVAPRGQAVAQAASEKWVQLHPATIPSLRSGPAMAYDGATNETVLYGGFAGCKAGGACTMLDDTWTWNGTTWTKRCSGCAPGAMDVPGDYQAPMAYDPATKDVLLFVFGTYGGTYGSFNFTTATWIWNGTRWSQGCMRCMGTTNEVEDAEMAYDPNLGTVIMAGLFCTRFTPNGCTVPESYETWDWAGSSWQLVTPLGADYCKAAGPCGGVAMATDWASGHVLLYGVGGGIWQWDGSRWAPQRPANSQYPPRPRYATAMAYNAASSSVVLVGGTDVGESPATFADTWFRDGTKWSAIPFPGGAIENEGLAGGPASSPLVLFGGEDGAGNLLNGTWTLSGSAAAKLTLTRIAKARFDFDARIARQRAALAGRAEQLAKQHLAAEEAVLADGQRGEQAEKDAAAASAAIASVSTDYKDTLGAVAHLKGVEQQMGEDVKGLLANEAGYDASIANLEAQILSGALTGDALAKAQMQLGTKRSGLAAIEATLAEKFKGTPAGQERTELIARLQNDGQRLFAARARQLEALAAEANAQTGLEVDRARVGVLDRELMDVAEKLAGFDPDVIEVTASAGGHEVFLGVAPVRYVDLYKLNQMIAQLAAVIPQLKAAKHLVVPRMLAAGKDVVASGDALASTLKRLAYARFAKDLFFEAADLGEAFLVKGGLVGLATEAAKKVAEKWTIKKLGLDKAPAGPGSIEAQINRQYQAELPDAWGPSTLINKAAEKDLKLVLFKAPKDAINAKIGHLVFEKLAKGKEWRFLLLAPGYTLGYETLGGVADKIRQFNANLTELNKGAVEGFSLKSIAKGLVKDVAKNAVNWLLDKIEANAWVEYADKDMVWRDWLPLYRAVSNDYETAEESRDKLLVEKADLLAGLDPDSPVKVLTTTKFENTATVTITLTLDGAQDPADPLQVLVDGVKATRVGNGNSYTVDASKVQAQPDGTLAIVVR